MFNINKLLPVAALEEEDMLLVAAAFVICDRDQRRRRRMQHMSTVWVKPWLLRRALYGQYEHLMSELNREDNTGYMSVVRVSP
jgi:hypothetical protein